MDAAIQAENEKFTQRHWWHIVRRQVIHEAMDCHAPPKSRWLDVGCGPGVLLASYEGIDCSKKVGLEIDALNLQKAKEKGLDVRPIDESWDFSGLGTFDLVTACDVLEHVEHDAQAVRTVHGALRPGGIFLVTVPALMSLWSDHDLVSHHYRRYTRKTLPRIFPERDWEIVRLTYFSTMLLPMIWGTRKVKNGFKTLARTSAPPRHDLSFGPIWMDRTLQGIFSLERPWLRRGGSFPLGSSLLLVARCRKEQVNNLELESKNRP